MNYRDVRSKAKKAIAEILERDPSTWDVEPLIEQRFAMANAFGVLEIAAQGFIFRLNRPSRVASHILWVLQGKGFWARMHRWWLQR